MLRSTLAALVCIVPLGQVVVAQDIAPVITPSQAAEGAFNRSVMGAHAKRAREQPAGQGSAAPAPGTPAFQRQACGNLPVYRRQHGTAHPQVRKLESLCAQAGLLPR